jgi:hypothetical protein
MRRKDKLPSPQWAIRGTGDNMRFVQHRGSAGALRVEGTSFASGAVRAP